MWEPINESDPRSLPPIYSHRLKVPGGWIVRTVMCSYNSGGGVAQTFVADAEHAWKLAGVPKKEGP